MGLRRQEQEKPQAESSLPGDLAEFSSRAEEAGQDDRSNAVATPAEPIEVRAQRQSPVQMAGLLPQDLAEFTSRADAEVAEDRKQERLKAVNPIAFYNEQQAMADVEALGDFAPRLRAMAAVTASPQQQISSALLAAQQAAPEVPQDSAPARQQAAPAQGGGSGSDPLRVEVDINWGDPSEFVRLASEKFGQELEGRVGQLRDETQQALRESIGTFG